MSVPTLHSDAQPAPADAKRWRTHATRDQPSHARLHIRFGRARRVHRGRAALSQRLVPARSRDGRRKVPRTQLRPWRRGDHAELGLRQQVHDIVAGRIATSHDTTAAVLGAGVMGLTAATLLSDLGLTVTIYADRQADRHHVAQGWRAVGGLGRRIQPTAGTEEDSHRLLHAVQDPTRSRVRRLRAPQLHPRAHQELRHRAAAVPGPDTRADSVWHACRSRATRSRDTNIARC